MMHVVYARGLNGEFGRDHRLPWTAANRSLLKTDTAFFRALTIHGAVIMGRNTFESLLHTPLPHRVNVVVTRSEPNPPVPGVCYVQSLESALSLFRSAAEALPCWVIGGPRLIEEALTHPECAGAYITQVLQQFDQCDTHIDLALESELLRACDFEHARCSPAYATETITDEFPKPFYYQIHHYRRMKRRECSAVLTIQSLQPVPPAHPEHQYLDILREVMELGVPRDDRTGTGTRSLFGRTMRFDLSQGSFPLLTTKTVNFRAVVAELLWMISGSTDTRTLHAQGVKIWDANASREALDRAALYHYAEGDLGPSYGHQWRHAGARYINCTTDYTGQGIDQIARLVTQLSTHPNDRRMILSSWNVADLDKMALPPCHMSAQFYVAHGALSCCVYQRSADLFLGVPFNIASYALLTLMLAQVASLRAGELIHHLGDAHIYNNHVDVVQQQLGRTPTAWPTVKLNPTIRNMDRFRIEDVEVVGYRPIGPLRASMAV